MIDGIYGYRVVVTDKNAGKPKKAHIKKPYMSDSYHRHIQKKWIKRYGLIGKFLRNGELVVNKLNNTIMMNSETY
jgi:hypothetical protein